MNHILTLIENNPVTFFFVGMFIMITIFSVIKCYIERNNKPKKK